MQRPGALPLARRRSRPAAAALAALLALHPRAGAAAEPLCDWLDALGRATAALDAGDPAAALDAAATAARARPSGPAAARASIVRGLALLAGGSPADAAVALRAGRDGGPPASRPPLALALGRALLAAGRAVEAVAPLEDAASSAPPALARTARLLAAEARLAAGDAEGAARTAHEVIDGRPGPRAGARARLLLARAVALLGHPQTAAGIARALALDVPERPEADEALSLLGRLPVAPSPALTGDERLARAERLLESGHAPRALAEVDAAREALPPPDPARAATLRALALAATGALAEAAEIARPAAGRGGTAGPAAAWLLARADARAGRTALAASEYAALAAATGPIPGIPAERRADLGDEAAFLSAWLWLDGGAPRRAARLLEAFARDHPRSPRALDAAWFAAWARLGAGDREGAARALARLVPGPLSPGALYWRARLEPAPEVQRALLRRAAAAGGDGWYGLLARARLASLGEVGPGAGGGEAGRDPGGEPLPADAPERLSGPLELLALGDRADARGELLELERAWPGRAAADGIARLAAFAGELDVAYRVARDRLGTTRRTLRWAYPDGIPPGAREAVRATGVDLDLVRAVIRRESAFRPDARSNAGAAGLMQLLPSTARRLGAVTGAGPATPSGDAATDVAAGALYLGLLLDRFGEPAVACAAFNAGPAAADRWATARAGLSLDAWVEAIPFKETRHYVEEVLAAWQVYRRIAGLPPALAPDRRVSGPVTGVAF